MPCGSGPDEREAVRQRPSCGRSRRWSEKGEGRQILLVPELNSHLMERRLAAATHNHGARTAEVLTFSRLADRVFSEVGGLAQQMLTPAGQLLTLQEAARRYCRGWSAWKGLADKPELLQEALRLIDECKTCAVAPETLVCGCRGKWRTRYLQKNCPTLHRF